jgi:hypothetical protein
MTNISYILAMIATCYAYLIHLDYHFNLKRFNANLQQWEEFTEVIYCILLLN